MRMVFPFCSSGGFAATSSTLFAPPPKIDQPPWVTLPCTCTVPSALPRISMFPEPLLTSTRAGAITENDRSNVADSADPFLAPCRGPATADALQRSEQMANPARMAKRRLFIGSMVPYLLGPPVRRYADRS